MTIFFTECVFFRRAINEILDLLLPANSNVIIVMDARFFSSLNHMLSVCHSLSSIASPANVIVMLKEKESAGIREHFPLSVHIQDSLARWISVTQEIIRSGFSPEETINCLTKIIDLKPIKYKHHLVMDFISNDVSITEIAKKMNISTKTVYSHLNDLKLHFNQSRLCDLYFLIKSEHFQKYSKK